MGRLSLWFYADYLQRNFSFFMKKIYVFVFSPNTKILYIYFISEDYFPLGVPFGVLRKYKASRLHYIRFTIQNQLVLFLLIGLLKHVLCCSSCY